jgi:hypothetical protein
MGSQQKQRDNSFVLFNDGRRLTGAIVFSGRKFSVRGDVPEGQLDCCQQLSAAIYNDKGFQIGGLCLTDTDEPFEHRPSFRGVAQIGRVVMDVSAWRKSSPKAGKFLSGSVSNPAVADECRAA